MKRILRKVKETDKRRKKWRNTEGSKRSEHKERERKINRKGNEKKLKTDQNSVPWPIPAGFSFPESNNRSEVARNFFNFSSPRKESFQR